MRNTTTFYTWVFLGAVEVDVLLPVKIPSVIVAEPTALELKVRLYCEEVLHFMSIASQ